MAINEATGLKQATHNPFYNSYPILFTIITVWAISRAILLIFYVPTTNPDTETYQLFADQLSNLDFTHYNGQRTPGYPLLILLAGNDHFVLWIIQSFMALATSLLIYFLVSAHTTSRLWALAAGLLSLTALNLLFFEAAVFTEVASAFLLALTCYLFIRLVKRNTSIGFALIVGGVTSLLALTRPQYIFAILLLPILTVFFIRRRGLIIALTVFASASVPVAGWMAFNKLELGRYTLTTLLGYNLSNHTGAFMEYAPDKYSEIRDIYLKYRKQKTEETGSHHMTIFWARKELLEKTGMSEVDLSRQFQQLSVQLIKEYPSLYLQSVAKAWFSFWAVPNYWELDKLKSRQLAEVLQWAWKIQHPIYRIFNILFMLMSLALLWQLLRHPASAREQLETPLLLSAIVIGCSVVQALVEYGDNPRYFIPNQPLVIAFVLIATADSARRWRPTNSNGSIPQ
jgi:hypothetical protein